MQGEEQDYRFSSIVKPEFPRFKAKMKEEIIQIIILRMFSEGKNYENFVMFLPKTHQTVLLRVWYFKKVENLEDDEEKGAEDINSLKAKTMGQAEIEQLKTLAIVNKGNNFRKYFQVLTPVYHWNIPSQDGNYQYIHIPMSYFPNGNLKTYLEGLQNRGEWLTFEQFLFIFSQLVKIVQCLHYNRKIIHRNINLSNICFDEDFGVRLTDFKFGFGEGRKDEKYSEPKVSIDQLGQLSMEDEGKNDEVGSIDMMPPEIVMLQKQDHNFQDESQIYYNEKVDVYRLGSVIYYMLYGVKGKRDKQTFQFIPGESRQKIPEVYNRRELQKYFKDFFDMCLKVNSDRRWTSNQCLYFLTQNKEIVMKLEEVNKNEEKIRNQLRIKKNKYRVHIKKIIYFQNKGYQIYVIILSNWNLCLVTKQMGQNHLKIVNFNEKQAYNPNRFPRQNQPSENDLEGFRMYREYIDLSRRDVSYDTYAGDQTQVSSVVVFSPNVVFVELSNSVIQHCFTHQLMLAKSQFTSFVTMRLNRLNEQQIAFGIPQFGRLRRTYQSFREAEGEDRELLEFIRSRYQMLFMKDAALMRRKHGLVLK